MVNKSELEMDSKIAEREREREREQKLEVELSRIRSEIQWRERAKKKWTNPKWWTHLIGFIWAGLFVASFMLTEKINSTKFSENYVLVWLVCLIVFIPIYIIILNNTELGKKYKKNNKELESLKKQEKKLNNKLEYLRILERKRS